MKLSLSLFFVSASLGAAELPASFVRAIHQIESSGQYGMILGDFKNGEYQSIGPIQIQKVYWLDSKTEGKYMQCTNLNYSVVVMENYFKRYCPKALRENDLEVLARTHNGGPNGPKNPKTKIYWKKIKEIMENARSECNTKGEILRLPKVKRDL